MQTQTLWGILCLPALLMVPLLWAYARETKHRARRLDQALAAPSSASQVWIEGQGGDARLYARIEGGPRVSLAVGAELDAACQRLAAAGIAIPRTA